MASRRGGKMFSLLGVMGVVLVLVLLMIEGEASQLNMYEGENCTGSWEPCWDRQCCRVRYRGSFRFYYNDGWPAYLYKKNPYCSGDANVKLDITYSCTNGFPFQSIKQTDA